MSFSCSPDPVTVLLKRQSWLIRQLEEILLVYYQLRQTSSSFSASTAISTFFTKDWLYVFILELIAIQKCIVTITLMGVRF